MENQFKKISSKTTKIIITSIIIFLGLAFTAISGYSIVQLIIAIINDGGF